MGGAEQLIMKEIWKDVHGYDGLYQVSNTGRVRKLRFINNRVNKEKTFLITPQLLDTGYYKVMLYNDGKYKNALVHRLVACAFIPEETGRTYVNHKDGNKTNNVVTNLEWCTQSENNRHAYRTGLRSAPATGRFGADSYKAIPVEMLDKDTGKVICRFGSLIDAAKYVGAKKSCHICSCCKGKLKTAYGHGWRYAT